MAKAWIKEEVMEESGKDLVSTSKSTMKSNMENFAVWQANERANMWSGAPGLKTEGKHCTLDAKQAPDCKGSDHWWFNLASCSVCFPRMWQPKGLLQGRAKRAGRRHAIKFERHFISMRNHGESWSGRDHWWSSCGFLLSQLSTQQIVSLQLVVTRKLHAYYVVMMLRTLVLERELCSLATECKIVHGDLFLDVSLLGEIQRDLPGSSDLPVILAMGFCLGAGNCKIMIFPGPVTW